MSTLNVLAKKESKPIPVDASLVQKASVALLKHLKGSGPDRTLFDSQSAIFLEFRLTKMPGRALSAPKRIALPHTLLNPEDGVELCLIVKDAAVEEVKEALVAQRVGGFTRVLGVSKLKKRYKEFKERRELVSEFAAFFCDDRVVTMMPKLCGKPFFSRNKAPLPVRIDRGTLGATLAVARDSTWLSVGAQTVGLRVGRAHFTPEQLTANILAVLGPAVENFPKKWKGVGSIHLRGLDTLALCLFKSLHVSGLGDDEGGDKEEEEEEEEGELEDGEEDEKEEEKEAKKVVEKKKVVVEAKAQSKKRPPPAPTSTSSAPPPTKVLKGVGGGVGSMLDKSGRGKGGADKKAVVAEKKAVAVEKKVAVAEKKPVAVAEKKPVAVVEKVVVAEKKGGEGGKKKGGEKKVVEAAAALPIVAALPVVPAAAAAAAAAVVGGKKAGGKKSVAPPPPAPPASAPAPAEPPAKAKAAKADKRPRTAPPPAADTTTAVAPPKSKKAKA